MSLSWTDSIDQTWFGKHCVSRILSSNHGHKRGSIGNHDDFIIIAKAFRNSGSKIALVGLSIPVADFMGYRMGGCRNTIKPMSSDR